MPRKQRKLLGNYIVADPEICHGKATFVGTRIMVTQVLQQVARGTSWDAIVAEWRGSITKDAIAEAVGRATSFESCQRGRFFGNIVGKKKSICPGINNTISPG